MNDAKTDSATNAQETPPEQGARQQGPLPRLELIQRFARQDGDTGSPEVQTALLTQRIDALSAHFKTHAKDKNARRGLLQMVSRRRRLLDYLKRRAPENYRKTIAELGLRR